MLWRRLRQVGFVKCGYIRKKIRQDLQDLQDLQKIKKNPVNPV